VTDSKGNGIEGKPLIFHVASGGRCLQPPGIPKASMTATEITDESGLAYVYFLLPEKLNSTSRITVTTGFGAKFQQLEFSASTDNGTGNFKSPFAPSNCIGYVNNDGSLYLTWTNNTDGIELYIVIEQQQSDGSWRAISPRLPPGTTSYTVTSPKGSGQYRTNVYTPDPPSNPKDGN
jgi:hypothetical protein